MTDRELCRLVAEVWTENGGDKIGLSYNFSNILAALEEIEEEKQEQADRQCQLNFE